MKTVTVVAILAAALTSFAPQDESKKAVLPSVRQDAFLEALKAGKIKEAYEKLLKGSPIAAKSDQVENLAEQTGKGIKLYGGVVDWDNFGIVRSEEHQAFGMALVRCSDVPLYYFFVWYRPETSAPWRITSVWFNDQPKDYWILRR